MRPFILSLVLIVLTAPGGIAGELAGVTMPDSATVGDQELVLNGLGLRKKAMFKIYVAGLYLPAAQTSPEEIMTSDTVRHMVMHFTSGLATGKKMCEAWMEGLEKNTPDASVEVEAQFETLCGYMEDMEKGGEMTFTYVPGQGTEAMVNGEVKGSFKGKEFADALFACWIGTEPPSKDFKQGLLGG